MNFEETIKGYVSNGMYRELTVCHIAIRGIAHAVLIKPDGKYILLQYSFRLGFSKMYN